MLRLSSHATHEFFCPIFNTKMGKSISHSCIHPSKWLVPACRISLATEFKWNSQIRLGLGFSKVYIFCLKSQSVCACSPWTRRKCCNWSNFCYSLLIEPRYKYLLLILVKLNGPFKIGNLNFKNCSRDQLC